MPRPARPATSLEALVRAHFGLSQYQLAHYLNLSRGFVAHLEAGRKPTPAAALARLTRLALLLPPPEGLGPPLAPPPPATPANPAALPEGPATPLAPGPLRARERECRLQALVLGRQLARCQARAAALARARQGLAQLRAALAPAAPPAVGVPATPAETAQAALPPPTPAETARLAAWLAALAADQAAAGQRAPAPEAAAAQVLLALRVAALTAEADALRQLLEPGATAPPNGV